LQFRPLRHTAAGHAEPGTSRLDQPLRWRRERWRANVAPMPSIDGQRMNLAI
jgi:hypothetical protein